MDAAKRWDEYELRRERQVDANHFVAVVVVSHNRGEFDLLGGHGSHVVVRNVDVTLLDLAVTPAGLKARQLDARSFETERDIEDVRRNQSVDIDPSNRRLVSGASPARRTGSPTGTCSSIRSRTRCMRMSADGRAPSTCPCDRPGPATVPGCRSATTAGTCW